MVGQSSHLLEKYWHSYSKIYDKRDDFNFEIVNFPFLDGDVPCSPSYGVFIFSAYSFCKGVF